MSELNNKNIKYCISITNNGNFGVYAKDWVPSSTCSSGYFTWTKIKVFDNRKEADDYFKSIQDLPKYA